MSRAPGFVPRAPAHGGVLPSEELSPTAASQCHPEQQQQQRIDPAEKLRLAIVAKTGKTVAGRLRGAVQRLACNGTPIEFLVQAVDAAPGHLLPPQILDEWLPDAIMIGSVPGQHDSPAPDAESRRRLALVEEDIARYESYGDPPEHVLRQRDELLRHLQLGDVR